MKYLMKYFVNFSYENIFILILNALIMLKRDSNQNIIKSTIVCYFFVISY